MAEISLPPVQLSLQAWERIVAVLRSVDDDPMMATAADIIENRMRRLVEHFAPMPGRVEFEVKGTVRHPDGYV
jgi:hypothetical protein